MCSALFSSEPPLESPCVEAYATRGRHAGAIPVTGARVTWIRGGVSCDHALWREQPRRSGGASVPLAPGRPSRPPGRQRTFSDENSQSVRVAGAQGARETGIGFTVASRTCRGRPRPRPFSFSPEDLWRTTPFAAAWPLEVQRRSGGNRTVAVPVWQGLVQQSKLSPTTERANVPYSQSSYLLPSRQCQRVVG